MLVAVEDGGGGFPAGFNAVQMQAGNEGFGMRMVVAMARDAAAVRVDRDVPFSRILVLLPLS